VTVQINSLSDVSYINCINYKAHTTPPPTRPVPNMCESHFLTYTLRV